MMMKARPSARDTRSPALMTRRSGFGDSDKNRIGHHFALVTANLEDAAAIAVLGQNPRLNRSTQRRIQRKAGACNHQGPVNGTGNRAALAALSAEGDGLWEGGPQCRFSCSLLFPAFLPKPNQQMPAPPRLGPEFQ
jgi:hypothetical protein